MRTHKARLHAIESLANQILSFDFRPIDDERWPIATAGAHIDVHLPIGIVRSYSLVNEPGGSHRYVIAVNREAFGQGGSRFMHDRLQVGDVLTVSEPRNNFTLREDASHTVLIAGGIGITPLWSMIQRLAQLKASWTLYYSARTRENASYVDQILSMATTSGGQVYLNFDGGDANRMLNIRAIIEATQSDADVYCCGPFPLLRAFDAATADREARLMHREYFAAPANATSTESAQDQRFNVRLARSNKIVPVGPGSTILDALLNANIDVPHSCMSGICRACETKVLAGVPDHRDYVLSDSERASGTTMIVCCSGAKSRELILDL
ncbi:Phenoxybenzoate dioxygenase subunit beta [Variovorax sp. SRS16]|uniref:PDR/VanB family oxidoreductase n=1 Tax=Variovorax sp. SRS16 TaxID=282217 RepID=UPI00131979CF|nr:PDR/VanB family oxidoreductase [Variovorax sp. SRS16]VTU32849.1 Phenoxybenzoate dioxygenase subunit beta [Variovorax sp. SRS16]